MPTHRVDITAEIVKKAQAQATAREPGTTFWGDKRDHYLLIRQRGPAADWIVKTRGKMRVIGDIRERHHGYLSVKAAREKGATLYADIAGGRDPAQATPPADVTPATTWTWADLDREYQKLVGTAQFINRRKKPASKGTADDVRLAFARPSFVALHPTLLVDLTRKVVEAARDEVVTRDGKPAQRQREKCAAYFRAAMTWAAKKHPEDSGLTDDVAPWWDRLDGGTPDEATMDIIEARQQDLLVKKSELTIKEIAKLLLAHERYCTSRREEGLKRITPGVRWGIWWVAFTANRRNSTVMLRRKAFKPVDEFGQNGWGIAKWAPDAMKAKTPFWLPLPPFVTSIAEGSMSDWLRMVTAQHGRTDEKSPWGTKWVFSSTKRMNDKQAFVDRSVYPGSLNQHIGYMREAKVLDDIKYFSPHLVRTTMANFIEKAVSPVASSLILAHTMKVAGEEAAAVTQEYYITSQRMDVKARAMQAWSEALLHEYLSQKGAELPKPAEWGRPSKTRSKETDL